MQFSEGCNFHLWYSRLSLVW